MEAKSEQKMEMSSRRRKGNGSSETCAALRSKIGAYWIAPKPGVPAGPRGREPATRHLPPPSVFPNAPNSLSKSGGYHIARQP